MNLMKNKVADYIVTGQWAKKAAAEASKYGKVNKIASSEDKTFRTFLTVRICRLMKMQIMYISAKIIQFTEPNSRNFRTRKARHW